MCKHLNIENYLCLSVMKKILVQTIIGRSCVLPRWSVIELPSVGFHLRPEMQVLRSMLYL